MSEPFYENSNNELLHDIAGVSRDQEMSNNELLTQIRDNGGGGGSATGKSQLLAEPTGSVDPDATVVLVISGGGTYTLEAPQYDGQIISIGIGDAVSTTFSGHTATGSDFNTGAGNTMFWLLGVDMSPFGGTLAWFGLAAKQGA